MSQTEATKLSKEELEQRHLAAEAKITSFSYTKPESVSAGKGFVALSRTDIIKGVVQVVKKHGGENNLHYHTRMDTFWMVLKGRVRFYGPGDVMLGEFGPHQGIVTPRYCRYWFENIGDDDLELLQVAAYPDGATDGGRTNVEALRFRPGTEDEFSAVRPVQAGA
jgi:oxalate decarboxylase/phosphoglucose isomerase-like protein (cupin superfamily)